MGKPQQRISQFHRVAGPDRQQISCLVDGEAITAFAGETVLTALLTRRTALRRFEFDDADRAGFCLMGACQDCWVELREGRRIRACTTLVEPGMHILTGESGLRRHAAE